MFAPISMPIASTIGVAAGATARLGGVISGAGKLVQNGQRHAHSGRSEKPSREICLARGWNVVLDSGGSTQQRRELFQHRSESVQTWRR